MSVTKRTATFFCPQCKEVAPCKVKKLMHYYHLYFIPICCNKVADYVKCSKCRTKFDPAVLSLLSPQQRSAAVVHALWIKAMLIVMIRVMLADGQIDDSEVSVVQKIIGEMTNMEVQLEKEDIFRVAADVAISSSSIQEDLEPFSEVLTDEGKDKVLIAMVQVAYADGEFREDEQKLIDEAAETLGTGKDRLEQINLAAQAKREAVK